MLEFESSGSALGYIESLAPRIQGKHVPPEKLRQAKTHMVQVDRVPSHTVAHLAFLLLLWGLVQLWGCWGMSHSHLAIRGATTAI